MPGTDAGVSSQASTLPSTVGYINLPAPQTAIALLSAAYETGTLHFAYGAEYWATLTSAQTLTVTSANVGT